MASVRLDHLSKTYRGGIAALSDLTVTIPNGEFVCIASLIAKRAASSRRQSAKPTSLKQGVYGRWFAAGSRNEVLIDEMIAFVLWHLQGRSRFEQQLTSRSDEACVLGEEWSQIKEEYRQSMPSSLRSLS